MYEVAESGYSLVKFYNKNSQLINIYFNYSTAHMNNLMCDWNPAIDHDV